MFHLEANPVVKSLKTFFYNVISEVALTSGNTITEENIDFQLHLAVKEVIMTIHAQSRDLSDAARIYDGFVLCHDNCPFVYRGFFNSLLAIKSMAGDISDAIEQLTQALMNSQAFKDMIPHLKNFILGRLESKTLKEYFYQTITGQAVLDESIDAQNIDNQFRVIIQALIESILHDSRDLNGKLRFGNEVISLDNCPLNYLPLYQAVLDIKLNDIVVGSNEANRRIAGITDAVMTSLPFIQMLPKLKKSILDMKQPLVVDNTGDAHLQSVSSSSSHQKAFIIPKVVTADAVRDTFYSYMKEQLVQALDSNFISVDDVNSQEPQLYIGLPGLALLVAINNSLDCEGIKLINGEIVTPHNCPNEADFREFLDALILCKERVKLLYANQLSFIPEIDFKRIQHLCLGKEIPEALNTNQPINSTHCATIINRVATKISQNKMFQQMIGNIMDEAQVEHRRHFEL